MDRTMKDTFAQYVKRLPLLLTAAAGDASASDRPDPASGLAVLERTDPPLGQSLPDPDRLIALKTSLGPADGGPSPLFVNTFRAVDAPRSERERAAGAAPSSGTNTPTAARYHVPTGACSSVGLRFPPGWQTAAWSLMDSPPRHAASDAPAERQAQQAGQDDPDWLSDDALQELRARAGELLAGGSQEAVADVRKQLEGLRTRVRRALQDKTSSARAQVLPHRHRRVLSEAVTRKLQRMADFLTELSYMLRPKTEKGRPAGGAKRKANSGAEAGPAKRGRANSAGSPSPRADDARGADTEQDDSLEYWEGVAATAADSKEVLMAWMIRNFTQPFPSNEQKDILTKVTGMSREQVGHWFINARGRFWKPLVLKMAKEIDPEFSSR
ncbi:unnamed protein product [Pedinophyceae sp. YPF-701]|nr:unnamed protein product [Pedinophyceae sp. YPF-701]